VRSPIIRLTVAPVLLLACLVVLQCGQVDRQTTSRPYLILFAFDAEGEFLSEQMSVSKVEKHLGRAVAIGELSGKAVVLAESGIGMTNAAMTAQKLIDLYAPRAVIMTGIAGGIDTTVHIGDIVACDAWMQHDYGYVGADGFEHMELYAYIPGDDSLAGMVAFEADSALLSAAVRVTGEQLDLEQIGERTPSIHVGGIGVTGNTFIDSEEKRQWLSDEFGALVTDMESAAVAHACTVNGVPFIIFRSASDLAGGSGSETAEEELEEFFEVAADNSGQVVISFLREL